MKRTEATGSIDGLYIDRNTELGREGTLLTAVDRNALQEEICHLIEASGQALDGADLYQLLKAVTLKLGSVAETITGVKTFSDIPVLPASNPTNDNQATRRAFVTGLDAQNVKITGDQSIGGVKSFTSIPVGPASNPTSGDQLTRKAYVDGAVSSGVSAGVSAHSSLTNNPHGVTRDQLGLGTGNSVNFANLNPPVDNYGNVMPNIGIGGFTYGYDNGGTVTLPPFGTMMVIAYIVNNLDTNNSGRKSGGTVISYGSSTVYVFAWRIA